MQQWQDLAQESFFKMVNAPDGDFEAIAHLSNTLNDPDSLQMMVEILSRHPQGKQAFIERPLLGTIDLQALHKLPTHTLGYSYADHLLKNGLTPLNAPPPVSDHQFLTTHITETHDIWHIVTGSNTDILGKIQLEAFYVVQLQASRFWVALLAKNLLKATIWDITVANQYLEALSQGQKMGKEAEPLFGIDWNKLWESPLEEIRTNLKIAVSVN